MKRTLPWTTPHDCGFISAEKYRECVSLCDEGRRLLGAILNNPGPFFLSDE